MTSYIALFRGINVGGRNTLPMKELVALLEDLGCCNVRTIVQSGNAVFATKAKSASRLAGRIRNEIRHRRGFEPYVLMLKREQFDRAIRENPFPEAEVDPKTLHLGFLDSIPKTPDLDTLASLKTDSERFHLNKDVFYLLAPEGVGRSRLAARAEKLLGVPMTDRNWKTVCQIRDLAKQLEC